MAVSEIAPVWVFRATILAPGEALGISEATVKWHINMILSRIDVTDRTQATVVALQRGIVHLP